MNKTDAKNQLEKLKPSDGFGSQEEAILWADKVMSLLKKLPDKSYYEKFSGIAPYFSLTLSADAQSSHYRLMKSILNTAIEDLKFDIENSNFLSKYFTLNKPLDVQRTISQILTTASQELWIQDAYLDDLIILELDLVCAQEIRILTKNPNQIFLARLDAARIQLKNENINIYVKTNFNFHDRYFIIDKSTVWSLGTSYNRKAGLKPTTLQKIEQDIDKIVDDFKGFWNSPDGTF